MGVQLQKKKKKNQDGCWPLGVDESDLQNNKGQKGVFLGLKSFVHYFFLEFGFTGVFEPLPLPLFDFFSIVAAASFLRASLL